jgi:hypothetical protein
MKICIKMWAEISSDDASPEVRKSAEIATAHWVEQLEAQWAEMMKGVACKHPGLKISFKEEDEP